MNLKKMTARVMRALPAVVPGSIGEMDVIDMLNQAQLHLSRLSAKTVVYTYELESSYSIVPLPVNMLTVERVYWKNDSVHRELVPAKERRPLSTVEEFTEPMMYYTEGSRIDVRPIPAVEGTVEIVYVPKPTVMTADTDYPDLENSHEYLIAHALHRIHMEANSQMAQNWDAEKMREEYTYLQTTDQNYRSPFQADLNW